MSDCCPLCSLLGRSQHPVCNTAAGVVTLAAGTPEEHAQLLAGLFLNARQQVAVAGSACHCLHTAHQLVAGMGPEELLAGTVFTLQHMTLVHRAHGRAGPMPGLDARQASGWSHNSSGQGLGWRKPHHQGSLLRTPTSKCAMAGQHLLCV